LNNWKYIWPYLVFGATIVLAVDVNIRLIKEGIDRTGNYAHTINVAGRQRLLSQAALTETILLVQGKGDAQRLNKLNNQWDDVHEHLQHGDETGRLMPVTEPLLHMGFEAMHSAQQQLHALLSSVRDSATAGMLADSIGAVQGQYVVLMDKMVLLFQRQAEQDMLRIKEKQSWAAIISGGVLVLEILLLVVPYHRKLMKAYKDLKANKILIEKQANEIQRQMTRVAEQNAALDKLNRSNELILAGINAGVWARNLVTGEETWSANFYSLLGYERQELPPARATFQQLIHDEDRPQQIAALNSHLEQGTPYQMNVRMQQKDGSYRWYETAGQAARNEKGEPVEMAGSIIDINEKIAYQQELESMNVAKDKMFAILSHDLRSPLNSLKTLIELQATGDLTQEEFTQYIEHVKEGVGFTLRTLDNVLVWASRHLKSLRPEPTLFNVSGILAEAERFHRYFAQQKKIAITYNAASDIVCWADPNHVFVALRNLVGNSIKYTHTGGAIQITATNAGNEVCIEVSDNGIGMSEALIHKILDRKEHVTTGGTNGEKGTGLGMGLVQDLVHANHGRFVIESQPGKGTTIAVYLPSVSPSAAGSII
jgi:PAS domain S-box-containing protein